MKRLPNLISCFRIVLSVLLPFLSDKLVLFAIAYFLCGISDVSDGYIARRWSAETKLGVKLDSAGDFIFYLMCLFILLIVLNSGNGGLIIACIIIIAIIRTTNLVITKVKFKQLSVMHTIGNKLTGFILFLVLPVCIVAGGLSSWIIIAASAAAALAAMEESVILLKSESYDANRRSVLPQMIRSLHCFNKKLTTDVN